jgi:hypothetical protein
MRFAHRQRQGSVADRFVAAVYAEQSGDGAAVTRLVGALAADDPTAVVAKVSVGLEAEVGRAWDAGWQPADLHRSIGRELGRAEAGVLRAVIASQSVSYRELGARVAPGWMRQLEAIGASVGGVQGGTELRRLAGAWPETIRAAVRLMALLLRLPRLPRLTEPPSAWHEGMRTATGPAAGAVLDKVRALLAKAESTTFDAEAEAFTAKAQELMARHRIDRAVLDAGAERGEEPVGRRLSVEDPYADAKAALLDGIAHANGCRAVWSKGLGFATVFGFPDELDAVEELYTSLLVQATAALRREGSKHDAVGRSRTKRFRRTFLVAFGVRIRQRLRETVDATVEAASAETGTALVPVLAARDERTRLAVAETFPEMRTFAPSVTDREGWHAGTAFGDRADLGGGPRLAAGER